jgi:hypothetical protein
MNLFLYYLFVIAMDYELNGRGSFSGRGKRIFPSVKCPDGLRGPPSLISNVCRGVKRPGCGKNTHLHLVGGQERTYISTPLQVVMG